jgi:hypothetical protein
MPIGAAIADVPVPMRVAPMSAALASLMIVFPRMLLSIAFAEGEKGWRKYASQGELFQARANRPHMGRGSRGSPFGYFNSLEGF